MSCHPCLNVVCVIHEYSKPSGDSTLHGVCDAGGVEDCICCYSVSQIVQMMPIECHDKAHNELCACAICDVFRTVRSRTLFDGISRIYCACTLVVKNGYVMYDYSNVVFKFLYNDKKFLEQQLNANIEAEIWGALHDSVKKLIIRGISQNFELGVGLRQSHLQDDNVSAHVDASDANTPKGPFRGCGPQGVPPPAPLKGPLGGAPCGLKDPLGL